VIVRRTLVLVAWGCLLAGCPPPPPVTSAEFDQAEIVQIYSVGYDEEQDAMFVAAEFYVGGLSLQLTAPSEVAHNHFELDGVTEIPGDIAVYSWYTFVGEGYAAYHRWRWTDTGGLIYINEFTFTPTYLDDPPSEISRSLGGTVSFLPALREGESAVVYLSSESGAGHPFWARDVGATTVAIDPDELERFGDEVDLEIEVWRVGLYVLQEATHRGGRIEGEYHSAHLPLRLGP